MASATPKKTSKVISKSNNEPNPIPKKRGSVGKFGLLTDKEIGFIKKTYFDKSKPWNERISLLTNKFEADERTVRRWLAKLKFSGEGVEPEEYTQAKKRKLDKTKKIYFFTWSQNNTPIHKEFWENMKAYAKHLNADIHVILGRYKNPTSVFQDSDKEFWSPEILPYADANRHNIHKNLAILSDIKIQPTATMPLSGMESITGTESCVIASPRVQLKVVPTLRGYEPKIMMSTGAVTVENYTDSKAGKKGEFHHTFGFVVVEVKDKDTYFMRQVTATKKGTFIDLWNNVENGKVTRAKPILGFVMGDSHCGDTDPIVDSQQRKVLNVLKPKYTMIHDVFNGRSVNGHILNDVVEQYNLEISNGNNLQNEIDEMIKYVASLVKYNPIIVSSNHNDWLDRVIRKGKLTEGGNKNLLTLNKLSSITLEGKAPKGLIAYIIDEHFNGKVKTLGVNDSFKIGGDKGFQCGQHGHNGSGGSKASPNSFRSVTRYCLAHTHSPFRLEGVIYAGTSTKLDAPYLKGLSSWLNSDVIINSDVKAQHLIYLGKNKEFTTFNYPKK